MSKLSLDALKERAEATASTVVLASISGGTENSCHDGIPLTGHLQVDTKLIPTTPPVILKTGPLQ